MTQEKKITDKDLESEASYLLARIDTNWQEKIIIQPKDSAAFIQIMQRAEVIDERDKSKPIVNLSSDSIQLDFLTRKDYKHLKMAAILRVHPDDLEM